MNERFFLLPPARQDLIRNSAMEEFGASSYKKTSADSIAKRAGISKGLLFHYFKDKRELYLYIYDYVVDWLYNYMLKLYDFQERDFFKALEKGWDIKVEMAQKHPAIFQFAMRSYYERDGLLTDSLRQKFRKLTEDTTDLFLDKMDLSMFKEGVDPRMVIRMLVQISEGMIAWDTDYSLEKLKEKYQEYREYTELLRRNLYREEYV